MPDQYGPTVAELRAEIHRNELKIAENRRKIAVLKARENGATEAIAAMIPDQERRDAFLADRLHNEEDDDATPAVIELTEGVRRFRAAVGQ